MPSLKPQQQICFNVLFYMLALCFRLVLLVQLSDSSRTPYPSLLILKCVGVQIHYLKHQAACHQCRPRLQQAFLQQYNFCPQAQPLHLLFLVYSRDSRLWPILKVALPWTTKTERWISFVVHEQVGTPHWAAQAWRDGVRVFVTQTVRSRP